MTPRNRHRRTTDLGTAVDVLEQVLTAAGPRLDPDLASRATALTEKIDARVRHGPDHTVVALAGATGSGKSSLFNALARADLAEVGVRRPTTGTARAASWGAADATDLLDWLGVQRRHEIAATAGDSDVAGMVLLDLPDFDSTVAAHRWEADRLLERVDVFVWVTDPQKYADAVLHGRYLARLAGHDAVTIVLLNQADRLGPDDRDRCLSDLDRLLAADGLTRTQAMATSATTGAGLDRLRSQLARLVAGRAARTRRLAADVDALTAELASSFGAAEPSLDEAARASGLIAALADAAGAPVAVGAIRDAYVDRGLRVTGWPFTRWVRRLRPDPLRRLRLGGRRTDGRRTGSDLPVLDRSSLPPPTAGQLTRVRAARAAVADHASQGLPERWADAVRAAADAPATDLTDALDEAVLGTDLSVRAPRWWTVAGAAQWLLAAVAVLGAIWLIVLAVLGWLRVPQPATPRLGPLPVPTVALIAGLVLGLLLTVAVRALVRRGGARRGARASRALDGAVRAVAEEQVLGPVRAVLDQHRGARTALTRL